MTHPAIAKGRVALVTGGASGIGLAAAQRFGAAGMKVVVVDLPGEALDKAVAGLKADGVEAIGAGLDVGDRAAIDALKPKVDALGMLSVLMLNAGREGSGGISESEAVWRRTIGVWVLVALAGLIFAHAAAWSFDRLALANSAFLGRQILLSQVVGYGLAVALGAWAYWAPTPSTLLGEVVDELQRVSWPSRLETTHATWVVMVCVAISAACLGLFDGVWLGVTGLLLGSPAQAG